MYDIELVLIQHRQPNVLIESINAPMSIQLSTVLSCRLYVFVFRLSYCYVLTNVLMDPPPPSFPVS